MKNSRYSVKFFLWIVGLIVVLGTLGWVFYASSVRFRAAESISSRPTQAIAQASAGDSRVKDLPAVGLDDGAAFKPVIQGNPLQTTFFLPIDGNGKENAEENKQSWLRLDPLTRILTPTSVDDVRWLLENRYPRPAEYRAIREPNAVLSQIDAMSQAGNYAEVSRLNDLLAAYFYEKGDSQWRTHASNSDSAFGMRLLAEEMIRNIQPGLRNARELIPAIARVQALGDPNIVDLIPSWMPSQAESAWIYMGRLNEELRQIEYARQTHILSGRIPHTPPAKPRPQPSWGRRY